jgi:hypothetical protein
MKQEQASSRSRADIALSAFSDSEKGAFQLLQNRYREDHDLFSEAERLRLRFVRWLHETKALES